MNQIENGWAVCAGVFGKKRYQENSSGKKETRQAGTGKEMKKVYKKGAGQRTEQDELIAAMAAFAKIARMTSRRNRWNCRKKCSLF